MVPVLHVQLIQQHVHQQLQHLVMMDILYLVHHVQLVVLVLQLVLQLLLLLFVKMDMY